MKQCNQSKSLSLLLTTLYLAGIVACLYLLSISLGNTSQLCLLVGSDCSAVVSSDFGKFFGMPVASFGLAYFVLQSFLYLGLFKHSVFYPIHQQNRQFSFLINTVAAAFSIYFIYLLFFVMDTSCIACIAVHGINLTTLACHFILLKKKDSTETIQPNLISIPLLAVSCSLIIFLGVNLLESRYLLEKERQKLANNLQFHLFQHGKNEKFEFTREEQDGIVGIPGIAIHQIVIIYKDGCSHCEKAKEKLIPLVKKYDTAIYLLMKNFKNMSKTRLEELQVKHTPVVFINGRRADGWEMPGFLEKYTDDCGC